MNRSPLALGVGWGREQPGNILRPTVKTTQNNSPASHIAGRSWIAAPQSPKLREQMRERLSDDLPDDATYSPEKCVSLPGLQQHWDCAFQCPACASAVLMNLASVLDRDAAKEEKRVTTHFGKYPAVIEIRAKVA
jgi:hypothetical protein